MKNISIKAAVAIHESLVKHGATEAPLEDFLQDYVDTYKDDWHMYRPVVEQLERTVAELVKRVAELETKGSRITFDPKPAFASKSKVNFTELDEMGKGFEPRRVGPIVYTGEILDLTEDEKVDILAKWKEIGPLAVERCPICGDPLKHLGFEKATGNEYGCGTCKTVFTGC